MLIAFSGLFRFCLKSIPDQRGMTFKCNQNKGFTAFFSLFPVFAFDFRKTNVNKFSKKMQSLA